MIRRRRSARPDRIRSVIRRSRWRQAWQWLGPRWLSLAGGAATFAGIIALLTAPQFRVQQVAVSPHSPSAQAALTRATQLSQVAGTNLFLVNTRRLARDVASLPGVRAARVTPRFPNVMEVDIEEREPIGVWRTAGAAFLVDDQGFLLGEAAGADIQAIGAAPDGVVVADSTGRELQPGAQVDQVTLLAARELSRALPAAGATATYAEYAPEGLVLVTDEGWRVVFGDAEALNTKLANFAAIAELAHTQNLRLALVDLRPKDRPYYQLAP